MVDVVLQGVWLLYRINKDESGESLPHRLSFRTDVVNVFFLKYSKKGRLSSSHVGIRYMVSGVCYRDTKHCQVQSEHRRIENPFKHFRWSVFA